MEEHTRDRVLRGYGIGSGIGIGPVRHMAPPLREPENSMSLVSPDEGWAQAQRASEEVANRFRQAAKTFDGPTEEILLASAMMAEDPAVLRNIKQRVQQGLSPERAVYESFAEFRRKLLQIGGKYAERAADLDDISQRIRAHIAGVPVPGVPRSTTPFVLVARDLAPADTATLDFSVVRALVTEEGGPTGHTAILARSKGLPAIIGCEGALDIEEGAPVIVDSRHGKVLLHPSDIEVEDAKGRADVRNARLESSRGPGVLKDGTQIQLLANLGSIDEAAGAVRADAEGVGLFRTEFLFIGSTQPPTRETQAAAYRELLDQFPGKKVVVRLLDAGADKPLPYLTYQDEANPALGLRGYRALTRHDQVLNTQLAALADAAEGCEAELWVMAPMIADAPEAEAFVKAGRAAGLKTLGVMAEVPSIAVMADQVARVTDFVSVGTNDLTQYALAADRTLASMSQYQDPWHPAVLRLMCMLGDAARQEGKSLGVCGEGASDPLLAAVMIGLGADSLSMAPDAIPEVRLALAEVTLDQAQRAATAACEAVGPEEARAAATAILVDENVDAPGDGATLT